MNSLNDIDVWCHVCSGNRKASFNFESHEYQCHECNSSFIEELNQGLETFLLESSAMDEETQEEQDEDVINGGEEMNEEIGYGEEENEEEQQEQQEQEGENDDDNNTQTTNSQPTINPSQNNTNESRSNQSLDHQIIQHVLERVFGSRITNLTPAPDGSLQVSTTVPPGTTTANIMPMGIIVRQTTYAAESGEPDNNNNDNNNNNGGRAPRIIGIENFSNMRQVFGNNFLSNSNHFSMMAHPAFDQLLHHILMNETSHAGAPSASEELIQGLNRLHISSETEDITSLGECCISQEAFEIGDILVKLPCGHKYKEEPIVHWLKMHNTCPVCRVEIQL